MSKIIVEATSDKFKNKFNNGSVLTGGKWLQVAANVPLSKFRKDSEVEVELQTNAKGYTSIVAVMDDTTTDDVEADIASAKASPRARKTNTAAPVEKPSYEDAKSKRILVQGIVQAAAQSPALMSLTINTVDEIADAVEALSLRLIELVNREAGQ